MKISKEQNGFSGPLYSLQFFNAPFLLPGTYEEEYFKWPLVLSSYNYPTIQYDLPANKSDDFQKEKICQTREKVCPIKILTVTKTTGSILKDNKHYLQHFGLQYQLQLTEQCQGGNNNNIQQEQNKPMVQKIQRMSQSCPEQYSHSKNVERIRYRRKKQRVKVVQYPENVISTKHIPKYFVRGLVFYLNQQDIIKFNFEFLKKKGYEYKEFSDFFAIIWKNPKISNLKRVFSDNQQQYYSEQQNIEKYQYFARLLRCHMLQFLRKESLSYIIHNNKIDNKIQILKYKQKFYELIQCPDDFVQISLNFQMKNDWYI